MSEAKMTDDTRVAVIEGPKGTAEIYEYVSAEAQYQEYLVQFNNETRTFNNLGEAYLMAGELAGNES